MPRSMTPARRSRRLMSSGGWVSLSSGFVRCVASPCLRSFLEVFSQGAVMAASTPAFGMTCFTRFL
jgi:hypothetical protein